MVGFLYLCIKYLTPYDILYLYKSQLRSKMECFCHIGRELLSPYFPVSIESKSVSESLWVPKCFQSCILTVKYGMEHASHGCIATSMQSVRTNWYLLVPPGLTFMPLTSYQTTYINPVFHWWVVTSTWTFSREQLLWRIDSQEDMFPGLVQDEPFCKKTNSFAEMSRFSGLLCWLM